MDTMIQALLFDLDDTLIDRDASMRLALEEQYDVFRDQLRFMQREAYSQWLLEYQERGYVKPRKAYEMLFREYPDAAANIDALCAHLDETYGDKVVLVENVREMLGRMSEGYRLAVITNGKSKWQNKKLRNSGIDGFFEIVIISEEVKAEKPDKDIFEICLRSMGLEGKDCAFIGDNPEIDIVGSEAAGIKGILKVTKANAMRGTGYRELENYDDLQRVVDSIGNEVL